MVCTPSDNFQQIENLMAAASRAITDENYALAEKKAVAAQALLMGLPSLQIKTGYAGGTLQYTPENINEFLKNVRRLAAAQTAAQAAANGGLILMPIEMVSARCGGDC